MVITLFYRQKMIFPFHQIIIITSILSIPVLSSPAQNSNSAACVRVCGNNTLPHPFGFSDGCGIKLNCSSGSAKIGDFVVENITSDQILIHIPGECNRPIAKLLPLFGGNFAPTWRNGILLENCSSPFNDCGIPSRLSNTMFGSDCGFGSTTTDNPSCYSALFDDSSEFLDIGNVTNEGNCSSLFSAVMLDPNGNAGGLGGGRNSSSRIPIVFQRMELGWWVSGSCGCDPSVNGGCCDRNANCMQVGGNRGFRCECREGFVGDGIAGGEGCRKASGHNRKVRIIPGIIGGASLVASLALIFFCVRRRARALKSRLSAKELLCEAAGNSSVPFYPYKEIERATYGFSEKQKLGTGAYGTVYAGKLHNSEWVAIKKIRHRDNDSVERVMNEIKLLSSVSHPNLVRLLGCCIEDGEQILVYEFMPNGTLSQHLQRERGYVLPWTIRLTIAAETAHAIAHLHSAMNPPIFHRDIKSSNILLDFNFNSKVADFGLSRFGMTDDSHISTAPQGTPGYVDPQYHQNFYLSDKSDVYSFGVVLVEIITAMKVVDFSRPHSEINLAALAIDRIGKGRVDEIIDPFLEPNRDAWTLASVNKMAELAFKCLAFHRDMRPSMMEVAEELEQIRVSAWAPMDENINMGSSVASSCSSPYQGSEKSSSLSLGKKAAGVGSRRVNVPQRADTSLPVMEEVKDSSPVSVQDPWLSEQSSPSTNSLLGKVVR